MRIFKAVATVALTALIIIFMARATSSRHAPTEVQGVLPELATVYDSIVLHGHVAEKDRRELLPAGPCRVLKSYAKIGQRVEAGQVLLELEAMTAQADTRAAIYSDIESAVFGLIEDSLSGAAGDYRQQSGELAAAVASSAVFADSAAAQAAIYQIISPINGVVMDIASAGATLSGILPCAAVSDLTCLAVDAQAGEEIVGAIAEGMECTIAVDALGLEGLEGRVELIMPYARQTGGITQSQQTKTQVVIGLLGGSDILRPGYSATARIAVNIQENAVMVPFEAIGQDEQNREYVMTLQNGFAVKKYILTGREMEDFAEVTQGLEAGELVILSPEKLSHGQRVVIK